MIPKTKEEANVQRRRVHGQDSRYCNSPCNERGEEEKRRKVLWR
nr:MAG TPA: hypothetical protein [Caudoviricetes sp.]